MPSRVRNTGIRPKSEGRVTLGLFPVNDLPFFIYNNYAIPAGRSI
jgi:hypothetical protein